MEEEIWKDIEGYEGSYQISNLGRVKNIKKNRKKDIVTASVGIQKDKNKYLVVSLILGNKYTSKQVKSMVFDAFSVNKRNSINPIYHIDGDYKNCRFDNLFTGDDYRLAF